MLVQLTTLKRTTNHLEKNQKENLTEFVSAELEKMRPFVLVTAQLQINFVPKNDHSEKNRLFCKKDTHARCIRGDY